MVYSAGVYDRACGQIPSHGIDWDQGAWKCISSAAKEASAKALLQVLIDGMGMGITCYMHFSNCTGLYVCLLCITAISNQDSQDLFELYADNAKGLQVS